jgi:hypothetical protein
MSNLGGFGFRWTRRLGPNAIRANSSSRKASYRSEGDGSFANCPDVGSREGTGFRPLCQQAVSVLETTGLLIRFLLDRASLSRLRIETVPFMTEDSLRQGDDYFSLATVKNTFYAIRTVTENRVDLAETQLSKGIHD